MVVFDFTEPARQSPKGILVIFGFKAFKFLKSFFILFVAYGISLFQNNTIGISPTVLGLGFVAFLVLLLIYAILNYLNFKFHVSADDFHLNTGILNKDNTIIPKSKIQNVYIKQNFLQQIINVVSLNIETAGDNKSEIEISALDKPTALALKKQLFAREPLADATKEITKEDEVFFRASLKRLLLEGVSQNHFKSFLIIASFMVGLYSEFEKYLEKLQLSERIEGAVNFDKQTLVNIFIFYLFIALLLLLVSLVFSVVKTLIVNFNLEVVEREHTLEINKGLFNKMSLTLTPSRIQNLVVKTNRVKAYFNLYGLNVMQAMVNKKQQKNFAMVAMEKEQLQHLIQKLLKTYSAATEKHKPAPYYKRILWLRLVVFFAILNLPAYFVFGTYFWMINIVFLCFALLYVHVKFKKAHFQISAEHISIGSGFIETVTNILEIHKIQALKLQQSIFQKRNGIASVVIATASKSVVIPYIKEAEANEIYNYLLFILESQDRDWM